MVVRSTAKNVSIMNTTIAKINSSRSFILLMSDSASAPETKSLQELIDESITSDYEYAHSLIDRLDDLLDLKRGESMYFLYSRDNKDSKSVIKRIQ